MLRILRNPEWPQVKLGAQETAPGTTGRYRDCVYHVWFGPLLFEWLPKDLRHLARRARG